MWCRQLTDQCEKGIKAMEALIAAEQGRCRDLTSNLEKLMKARCKFGWSKNLTQSHEKSIWFVLSGQSMHLNQFHTSDTASWKLCTLHFKTNPLRGRIELKTTVVNRQAEIFLISLRDTNGDSLCNDRSQLRQNGLEEVSPRQGVCMGTNKPLHDS